MRGAHALHYSRPRKARPHRLVRHCAQRRGTPATRIGFFAPATRPVRRRPRNTRAHQGSAAGSRTPTIIRLKTVRTNMAERHGKLRPADGECGAWLFQWCDDAHPTARPLSSIMSVTFTTAPFYRPFRVSTNTACD